MNQFGRSMIEMLGVLAIIGVLSVGGISGYKKAMTKFKTNSAIETMLTIATNIQNITLRNKNYNNILTAAKKMKAIPNDVIDGDSLVNPFGGSIEVNGFGRNNKKTYFYVALNGLPKEVCIDIATKDYGNALIYAGKGNFSSSASNFASRVPENLKQANATCAGAAANGAYCLKQVMSPTLAAQGCDCTNAGGCTFAIVAF